MNDKRGRFEAEVMPLLDAACRFARWLSRSPADADDVVQEAFLRAYRNFDSLRGGDVKAWLLTIVRNCHSTAAAKASRRDHVPLPDEDDAGYGQVMTAATPDPQTAIARNDEAQALRRLIDSMPQEHREVLILREMEDMGYREIAQVMDVPIGTVMSRLARARANLKTEWLAAHPEAYREVR